MILTSECLALGEGAKLPILNILGLARPARVGLELMTSWMLSEALPLGYYLNS
jgi:hypothetical protein